MELYKIIQIMDEIIYTPPYLFLFGRINIEKNNYRDEKKIYKNMKDTNKIFYEGFDIDVS